MAMFENFPYTDLHNLNMDWIIKIAKDFLDQYTHIQQLIADGETSLQTLTNEGTEQLQTLTTEGLQQLQDKADALEAALDAWYNQHSEDISDELTQALTALNAWYTEHQGFLDTYLSSAINEFNQNAYEKGQETIASIPADYTTLANQVQEIVAILEKLVLYYHSDLLYGRSYTDTLFINPSTGERRELASFYTFENVPIPYEASILFPMDYQAADDTYIRSVTFYDASGTFISGVSGNQSTVINGIPVPAGAVVLCATLRYVSSEPSSYKYLSTVRGGDQIVNKNILDDVLDYGHTNILLGHLATESWFVNPTTGEGSSNVGFFSYVNVEINDELIGKQLYPFANVSLTNHWFRSVVFYDASFNRITGNGEWPGSINAGITVPNNAKYVSVTIPYVGAGDKPEHYFSSRKGGDYIYVKNLNPPFINMVRNISQPAQLEDRKPTFSFIFDDGRDTDVNVYNIFNLYNLKCGFALIAGNVNINTRYLDYQREGFEILSHSTSATPFSEMTLADVETALKTSRANLEQAGYSVKGFVTPSSISTAAQRDIIKKYYQYGFGAVESETVVYAHPFIGKDIRQLNRVSLESNNIDQLKAQVDAAFTDNAYMIFYGHEVPSTDLTDEKLKALIEYILAKTSPYMIETPGNAINNFYSFRHSDLLDMID